MPVVDSTVLIYLARAGLLFILKRMYGQVLCPLRVYQEVVEKGIEKGYPDAESVKREVGRSLIMRPPEQERDEDARVDSRSKGFRLGKGELEGVALSCEISELFISDDDDAKRYAESLGIEGKGTIYLILKAYRGGIISKDGCSQAFEKMVSQGFRVSPDVVCIFYKKLREIKTKGN